MKNIIAHLDMDAFFASVEERDNPWMRGQPVVVGADPKGGKGRGVVSTANYTAREYGIGSATPISTAWRLSQEAQKKGKPAVIFWQPNFSKYEKTSERIMKILQTFSPTVVQTSIDEAYFDLSIPVRENFCRGMPVNIAMQIKKTILSSEGLTCSIGIGPNKLIAKIASDFKKPDGLTVVPDEEVKNFLSPLPVRKIPGIGPKTEAVLKKKGIHTIKDIQEYSEDVLYQLFGKWGRELYKKAHGESNSFLEEASQRKSIGQHHTFLLDTLDASILFSTLQKMSEQIFQTFTHSGYTTFRTVVLTVRFSDFMTKSRSHTFSKEQNTLKTFHFEAMKLLTPFLDSRENPKKKKIRLIGVRIEKII